jgi:hypothetical protein
MHDRLPHGVGEDIRTERPQRPFSSVQPQRQDAPVTKQAHEQITVGFVHILIRHCDLVQHSGALVAQCAVPDRVAAFDELLHDRHRVPVVERRASAE